MSIIQPQKRSRPGEEFEELYSENLPDFHNPYKKYRSHTSPSGRCAPSSAGLATYPAYAVGSQAFLALKGLFPGMSDKVIADVLAEYGDNIDAAIKHLNDLQLSLNDEAKTEIPSTEPSKPHLAPGGGIATTNSNLANGAQQELNGVTDAPNVEQPVARTAKQWVQFMVEQMSAASNLDDAKSRASEVLKAFEQAIMQHAESHEGHTGELARENALLKRAVTIQNARLQELSGKEAEANELRVALDSARQRVQMLEVQNYSLQLHLKQAADARDDSLAAVRKNPDVF